MSDGQDPEGFSDDELDFAGLDNLAALLGEVTDDDRRRMEPPPSVWNAILDTVAADRNGHPDRTLTLTDVGNGSVVADISPIEQQATTTMALARRRSTDQPMLPAEINVGRRQWLPVAAAVAVTILGGLVTWAFTDEVAGTDDEAAIAEDDEDLVAVTEINDDDLSEFAVEGGEARLMRSGDRYFLDIDVPELPTVDGYYELWIIDPDVEGMFSLGVVSGDARYELPDNLDPADYPVVDVSVEDIDGDPTHSGRSVWRGVLDP